MTQWQILRGVNLVGSRSRPGLRDAGAARADCRQGGRNWPRASQQGGREAMHGAKRRPDGRSEGHCCRKRLQDDCVEKLAHTFAGPKIEEKHSKTVSTRFVPPYRLTRRAPAPPRPPGRPSGPELPSDAPPVRAPLATAPQWAALPDRQPVPQCPSPGSHPEMPCRPRRRPRMIKPGARSHMGRFSTEMSRLPGSGLKGYQKFPGRRAVAGSFWLGPDAGLPHGIHDVNSHDRRLLQHCLNFPSARVSG